MSTEFHSILRDGIVRTLAAVGLGSIALIHLLDAPGTFQGAPYKGSLYVALIAGSLSTAVALVHGGSRGAWTAAALLAVGAIAAYLASRTVGLPQGGDDIGNWTEPLGLASLC